MFFDKNLSFFILHTRSFTMADLKKMYTTILGDHFPLEMKISFDEQTLVYRKYLAIPQEDGSLDERGIRYGENPDQEAAHFTNWLTATWCSETVNSSQPGNALVSGIPVEKICCRLENIRQDQPD